MRNAVILMGGMLMTMSTTAAGQASPGAAAAAASFEMVSGHLLAAAEQVPADRYDYRPTEGVRTFLQLVAHVADGNDYYCRHATGDAIDWDDPVERGARSREEAVAALRASIGRCRDAFARTDAELVPVTEALAHANLHYGNIIVYLRMMGFVPPSS